MSERKIRVSKNTYQKLKKASDAYDLPISQIVRMAIKKGIRSCVVEQKNSQTTTRGAVLCVEGIYQDISCNRIRTLVDWYLGIHDLRKPEGYWTELIEGVDYIIKEGDK